MMSSKFLLLGLLYLQTASSEGLVFSQIFNQENVDNKSQSVTITGDTAKVVDAQGKETVYQGHTFRIVNGVIQGITEPTSSSSTQESSTTKSSTSTTSLEDLTTSKKALLFNYKLPSLRKSDVKPSDTVRFVDPGLDARQEIANYNKFMDEIFRRMNAAIKAKNLDPMSLRLKSKAKVKTRKKPESETKATTESILILEPPAFLTSPSPSKPTSRPKPPTAALEAEEEDDDDDLLSGGKVRGWLYGMSTLRRSGDVSIFIHESHKTIQCPFSLGPLELKVSKSVGSGQTERTKSAKATTDVMMGLMDMRIDRENGNVEIVNVIFDEPGGVHVKGSLKRRVDPDHEKRMEARYKLVLASRAAMSLKNVARLVVSHPIKDSPKA